eukprot:817122_1
MNLSNNGSISNITQNNSGSISNTNNVNNQATRSDSSAATHRPVHGGFPASPPSPPSTQNLEIEHSEHSEPQYSLSGLMFTNYFDQIDRSCKVTVIQNDQITLYDFARVVFTKTERASGHRLELLVKQFNTQIFHGFNFRVAILNGKPLIVTPDIVIVLTTKCSVFGYWLSMNGFVENRQ